MFSSFAFLSWPGDLTNITHVLGKLSTFRFTPDFSFSDMAESWKTVTVFVTSFGKDFAKEREVIIKEVGGKKFGLNPF